MICTRPLGGVAAATAGRNKAKALVRATRPALVVPIEIRIFVLSRSLENPGSPILPGERTFVCAFCHAIERS
jgi:hypothetical protein